MKTKIIETDKDIKLKDKFLETTDDFAHLVKDYGVCRKQANKCVEISNNHAIGFAVFINRNCSASHSKDALWYYDDVGWKTTDELLEIYNSQP